LVSAADAVVAQNRQAANATDLMRQL